MRGTDLIHRVAPVTRVDGRVELQVLTTHPDGWAQVLAGNGWTAWVDGRRLTSLSQAPSVMHLAAHHFAVLGGALAVFGTFLPWFTFQGASANAWEVPVLFLLNGTGDADQVKFGGFMLVEVLLLLPYVIRRRLPKIVVFALAAVATERGDTRDQPQHLPGGSARPRRRCLRDPHRWSDDRCRRGLQQGAQMKRGEGGFAETLVAVGIAGLVFIAVMGVAVIQDLTQSKGSGWRPSGGPALTGPVSLFVGPPLAGTPAVQKCIKEKMEAKGFVYGAEGWRLRSGGLAPPTSAIGMDQNKFRGEVIAWKEGFNKIVAPEYAAVKKVCESPEQTLEKTTTTVAIQGRYRIIIPENQTCSGPVAKLQTGMTSATASGSGSGFSLTFSVATLTGRIDADRAFDVKGPVSGNPEVTIRMEGRFVPFGETMLIRSGTLVITAPGETCRTTFEGEREK